MVVLEFAAAGGVVPAFAGGTLGNVVKGGDAPGSFGTAGTTPTTPDGLTGIAGAIGDDEAAAEDKAVETDGDDSAEETATEFEEERALAATVADVVEASEIDSLCKVPGPFSGKGVEDGEEALSNEAGTVAFGLPLGSTKVMLARSLGLAAAR
jgi:hypothetical protein